MWRVRLTCVAACLVMLSLHGCKSTEPVKGCCAAGQLRDGIYHGVGKAGKVQIAAAVTIREQRIANIALKKHRLWKGGIAEKAIPGRIIGAQSTQVDAVTGATLSSRAIMKAVDDAIRKASLVP